VADGGLNLALEKIADFFVEDLGRWRVSHVVALGVVLRGIHMGGHDALLLDPEAVDVVLEAQAGGEERRQPEGVVVPSHATVHPPVQVGHGGAKSLRNLHHGTV
jgi:hypothetical protein